MTSDPFLVHEVLDRAHLFLDLWDRSLVQHPTVVDNPELSALADRIATLMGDFYQKAGDLSA